MLAATMLPTFDAQMMDYPSDIDVPMNTSNSESWYLGDLAMEDDPQTPQPKANAGSGDRFIPTIEVDMEDWEAEPVEYEMADEVELPYEEGAPLDVEVYDVSQIASRIHTPSELDVARPLPENLAPASHALSPSFSPAFEVPMLPESDDALQVAHEVRDVQSAALDESSYSAVAETSQAESTHLESFPPNSTEDSLESLATAGDPPNYDSSRLQDTHNDTAVPPTDAYNSVDHYESGHVLEAEITAHSSAPPLHAEQAAPSDSEHGALLNHDSEQIEEQYGHESNAEEAVGSHEPSEQVDQQPSADPHEISEGVYIDPPPAILLSFTLPDEEAEFYLFNQLSRSGASTPSADSHRQQLRLLLHDKPTLFYEPLTSVFEALRIEPEVAQLPDFANGELVLNAYDVDLSVSEDNFYAREISLHDLNVLHDGSGLSGPLRLHLHSSTPRFIFRYHEIQYQIAQAHISSEAIDPSVVEQHESDGLYPRDSRLFTAFIDRVYAGQHNEGTHQIEGQVIEEESLDHQTQVQDQPPHELEEQATGEDAKTGEIPSVSGELPENSESTGEILYIKDAQDRHSGDDNDEVEQNEQNELSTTLHVSDPPVASDVEGDELYQGHEGRTDELLELPAGDGEPLHADSEAEDDGPENAEEFLESADHPGVHGSTPHEDGAVHEDVDAPIGQGLSEDSLTINVAISGSHEEFIEPADESYVDFPDILSTNVVDTILDSISTYHNAVEQEQEEHDRPYEEFDSEGHATTEAAGPSTTVQPGSDRQIDDPEGGGDEWDDELDAEGEEFYDAWEAEQDAESNESSVTLSSTSSKRTYGQVEPDDEVEEDHESLYATSRPKRLRSQYQPE